MIYGLNLSGETLNEAGRIKIGEKGKERKTQDGNGTYRVPVKLDHFIITTTEKDEKGDFIIDKALMDKISLSDDAIINDAGHLVGIPIKLIFDDIEKNFPSTLLSYVSGKRSCQGDGTKSFKRLDNFEKERPCPCKRIESGYEGKDKCKPFGALICFIDGVGLFGQSHKFRTTSKNSLNGIIGGMRLISAVTKGRLANIPLMLTLTSKTTSIPSSGTTTTVYVVSICYRGDLDELRTAAIEMHQKDQQYQIELKDSEFDSVEDETDFVDEYFPGNANNIKVVKESKIQEAGSEDNNTEEPENNDDSEDISNTGVDISSDTDINNSENQENSELNTNINTIDDKELWKSHIKTTPFTIEEIVSFKPSGSKMALFQRFIIETNIDKALPFSKRIDRDHLVYFLVTNHWDAVDLKFDKKIKKPALLEFVANILKQVLKTPESEDGTNGSENIEPGNEDVSKTENKKGSEPESKKTEDVISQDSQDTKINELEPVPRKFDDSGPITQDQLRIIIITKKNLESKNLLKKDPAVWAKHVSYFFDEKMNLQTTAKNLTVTQGDNLIKMLKRHEDDGIPF